MDSKAKNSIIHSCVDWTHNFEMKLEQNINNIQSLIDKEIIDLNDLYVFVKQYISSDKWILHRCYIYNPILLWMTEQIDELLTDDDVRLIYNTFDLSNYDTSKRERFLNLSPQEKTIMINVFISLGEDEFINYLYTQSLDQITWRMRRDNVILVNNTAIKKHVLDRIDELRDMHNIEAIFHALYFIGNCDSINQLIVEEILFNKYNVLAFILYRGWDNSEYVKHMISIYLQTTNEKYLVNDDPIAIYIGVRSASPEYSQTCDYISNICMKKYLSKCLLDGIRDGSVNSMIAKQINEMRSRYTTLSDSFKNMEKNNFMDIVQLESEAIRFNQLLEEMSTFITKLIEID